MARVFWRHPSNTQVAQVTSGTITTTTNGHTYTVTITDDNGDTAAITYTVVNPPDTTVTLVATGFITAWNASLNPLISKFTATQSSGQVILTADNVGRPFSIAFSGTGTWSSTGNTTNSVSNSDLGQATNLSTDAVLANSDDFVIPGGSVDILYGLNQSSITLDEFVVDSAFTGKIGRFEDGKGHYLRIDPDSFIYNGRSTRALFDIGSANIDVLLEGSGSPETTGRNAVYIKGSNIDDLNINSGNVGVATANSGDTATVSKLNVGKSGTTAPTVDVGAGVTLTTANLQYGTVDIGCATTTINAGEDATVTTSGSGAITTINARGTVYPNSSGTVTNLNVYGTVDLTKDKTPRTITNCTPYPGSTLIYGPHITFTNGITPPTTGIIGTFTVEFKA